MRWLALAEALKPTLQEVIQRPPGCVEVTPNSQSRVGFDAKPSLSIAELESRSMRAGDSVIVDFGGHRTGYLSFSMRATGREPDAPVRLRLVFGEVLNDVGSPLHAYTAWLSEAWLPEEVVTIDDLPQQVRLPRRHAFRYVRIDVVATSNEVAPGNRIA